MSKVLLDWPIKWRVLEPKVSSLVLGSGRDDDGSRSWSGYARSPDWRGVPRPEVRRVATSNVRTYRPPKGPSGRVSRRRCRRTYGRGSLLYVMCLALTLGGGVLRLVPRVPGRKVDRPPP